MFHVKHYNIRKEITMTFEAAMTAAKGGATIKRSGWVNKTVDYDTSDSNNPKFMVTQTTTIDAPFLPSNDDMTKDDWVQA